jgi:hypothetical protein
MLYLGYLLMCECRIAAKYTDATHQEVAAIKE